ncbi:metallophosphoesterase [Synechococcales cyanobacterium C]|uniref:Metallophosphoesterase n=1 Tax=Petrachloros mirabilis ULC683 TaxID=2781853 RepID=A0A8K1ZWG0_9CYAN|nr:metallophosphoesterase [Petrachloros mirabilis]NCJ05132.1 metallophosphoesterase [Petrachloros mirabilis ULC683]
MAWTRRQLLIAGGGLVGVGLAQGLKLQSGNGLAQSPVIPPEGQSLAMAPAGFYAPPRGSVRIAVISDLNSQYGSTHYEAEVIESMRLLPQWKPDLVLCGGDMIAGQSLSLSRGQVQAMWAAFDRHVAAPLRQAGLPFGFTIGNHDGSGALEREGRFRFALDRELARAYWKQPSHNPGLTFVDQAQFPFSYTFTQNQIFYLVWDASTAQISEAQLGWVERSLASAAAQQARLRMVIGHLPLYGIAVGRDRPGEFLNQAERLRSLLERYRVHTYISGHHHAYYPGHRGQLQLLHTGALGSGPRRLLGSDRTPQKTLTIVDVSLEPANTRYTTYDMTTRQVLDSRQLPTQISAPNGRVFRRDINPGA